MSLLEFHPDTIEAVRKQMNFANPERVEEALNLLEEWVKMQNHFVMKDFPRIYLETILMNSKGLVENCKQMLDKLCTFKTLLPNLFPKTINKENFMQVTAGVTALLPKLTKEHYRVYVLKMLTDNFESTLYQILYQYGVLAGEYCRIHDYNGGFVMVLDNRDVNVFKIIAKANIMDLRNFVTLMSKGYGWRIKAIHILSNSKLLDPLITLYKPILGTKLAGRISLHNNLETLHEVIEKDIMPEDYGGKEKSLKELHDLCLDILLSKDHLEFFQKMIDVKTDETRRQADVFTENYIGMPGSFRALSVD